jgi:putative hydrolase of the HAD superfamily
VKLDLLIDADDTLWENIVVFERVADDFAAWVRHPEGDAEVLRILADVQEAMLRTHGYGTKVFVLSLQETLRRVVAHEPTAADVARIESLVEPLAWEKLDVIAGVPETLAELASRHDLTLVTKGADDEQRHKVEVSGLGGYFGRTEVVPDKDADTYRRIVADHGLDPARTWMIGNSPRSDILPALEAGLRAAYVPHPRTWSHELRDLPDDPAILRVPHFRALLDHF